MRARTSAGRQSGQAMTELLVACLVLIPLFLVMPLLGNYMDISHTTIQASRYTAWERTVWPQWTHHTKSDIQLGNEAKNRLFSQVGEIVTQRDGKKNWQPNPSWTGYDGQSLLPSYNDVNDSVRSQGSKKHHHGEMTPGVEFNKVVGILIEAMDDVYDALAWVTGAKPTKFDPELYGMYEYQVSVKIKEQAPPPPTAASEPLLITLPEVTFKRNNVIISDGWGVSDPNKGWTLESQLGPLVPFSLIGGDSWIQTFITFMSKLFTDLNGLEFGYLGDGVPCDRQNPPDKSCKP